jgi:hypothetical protein
VPGALARDEEGAAVRRRNLLGVEVTLPDFCRHCGAHYVAKVAKANINADENFVGSRYRLTCANCEQFRGFVGKDLELLLEKNQDEPQPIQLGVRAKKKTDDDDTRPSPSVTP